MKSRTEDVFHSLFQYAPDALFQVDPNNLILLANPKASTLTGYAQNELQGMHFTKLFSKEELESKPLRRDLLEEGKTIVTERDVLRKDGSFITVEMNSVLTPDGDIWTFFRDISALMKQRRNFHEIEKRYEIAFKTSPDSVAITDMNGVFVEVNHGFCDIFGWNVAEVLGKSAVDLDIWVDLEDRKRLFEMISKDGRANDLETRMRRKDGTIMVVLASFSNLLLDGVPHNLSVIRDITLRKQMEEELRVSKKKAEESDQLKTAFLGNISHEIRTPMNAILGLSELLSESNDDSFTRQEYIQIIRDRGKHLMEIIDDIIELSKIEADQVDYHFSDVSICELLDEVEAVLRSGNQMKDNVQLCFHKHETVNRSVVTDGFKLKQILLNLLSNALKYTDAGEVSLDFCEQDEDKIEFIVKDTGIGISEEDQRIVFDRFRRIEGDQAISKGGTGMGLSICKAYLRGLGGDIELTSSPGKGSVFRFFIPSKPPS